MPNKCTVCGQVHPDDAKYLLNGCNKCGSKFFFYVREEYLEKAEKDIKRLTKSEVKEMEQDIRDIIPEDVEKNETVILDVEAIRVIRPGKYEIDVMNLFHQKPIVIRVGEGKYELDLSILMSKMREKITGEEDKAFKKEAPNK